MKKKIALSFLVMALMMALVGGATFAWFTSTSGVENNSFAAGTIDVNKGGTMPIVVTGIAPGWSATKTLIIQNDGTLPADFKALITGATGTANNVLGQNLKVKVYVNPSDVTLPSGYTAYYASYSGQIGPEYTLATMPTVFTNAGLPALVPGEAVVLKLEFSLPNGTGNDCQGQSSSANLTILGTQDGGEFSS